MINLSLTNVLNFDVNVLNQIVIEIYNNCKDELVYNEVNFELRENDYFIESLNLDYFEILIFNDSEFNEHEEQINKCYGYIIENVKQIIILKMKP
jgi:hypothetical protein